MSTTETVERPPAPFEVTQPSLRYLPGLDGLRGISVLAVIVFHHYLVGGHEIGWAPGGFLGVEVFFVVSGYLITSLLLAERRESGTVSYRQFYLRRARRLLPALWTLLAVVTAYSLLFLPDAIGMLRSDVIAALTYTSNWWQILAHRSYIAQAGRPELLKHLWSLAIEEQYYLAWPVLLVFGLKKLGRTRMLGTIFVMTVVSTIALGVFAQYSIEWAYYGTFSRMSGLLLGSAFAFFFAPYRLRGLPGPGARVALDAAGAFGLLALLAMFGVLHPIIGWHGFIFPVNIHDDLAVFRGGFLLVDIATLLVVAAAVHPASDVGRALGWRPLRYVGVRSYSLYLWHYPIFCITRPGLDIHRVGIWFLSFRFAGWPVFATRLALSFAAAEASFQYIEQPIRHGAIGRYRDTWRGAQGKRRSRLTRRGLVIGGSLTCATLMLGAGLASAKPQVERIPGIDLSSGPDNGASVDQSALNQILGRTTTTVAPAQTTGKHKGKTRRGTTPTTKPPPAQPPAHILAIGDSVMLGAKNALQTTIPGIAVDAIKSRQFYQAITNVKDYEGLLALPKTIVIGLGTNGRITDDLFNQMMQTIGPGHQVYFLTARVPRLWESEVNNTLHAGVKRWKNAHVLEWHNFSGCHDDWFVFDGFHLQPPGQRGYAAFVRDGLSGHPDTTCKK